MILLFCGLPILSVGAYSQINPETAIYGKVVIGKYVMVTPSCMLAGTTHFFGDRNMARMFQGGISKGRSVTAKKIRMRT